MHVRREVGRFYVTTALINVGLGLATGCLMMACGMPNPFLWGTIAGLLNFIPYAGSTATFSVVAGGNGPFTYQWRRNGVAIAGATAASYTTPALMSADSGSMFSVAVTNATPCAASSCSAAA